MRFQKAIRLHRDTKLTWAEIAADCGYSDQAHLSHEVKAFAARTPGEIGFQRDSVDDYFNGDGASTFFDTVYL